MIYTVTLNPAIDYVVFLNDFKAGGLNRAKRESVVFGGKGINVSTMLTELGLRTRALGFLAGFTGQAIEDGLIKQGIETDFVHLEEGLTRINVKLKCGEETEINAAGPAIPAQAVEELFKKLERIGRGEHLVLSGSVPKSLGADIYEQILKRLQGRGINFTVDTSGTLLKDTLKYEPFLIKPNAEELGEIFAKIPADADEAAGQALALRDMGARNVLVSMGAEGSVLAGQDGRLYRMGVAKGELVNSVGAGDSMVAGFLAGYIETQDLAYAQLLGTAAGGATAFCEGIAPRERVTEVLEELKKG